MFDRLRRSRHPLARLMRAAARGDAAAQFLVGQRLLSAHGVGHSPVEAVRWLTRAAEQGHAEAQHCLSLVLLSGARGRGFAAAWLTEAASRPAAAANAALLFPDGDDVAPDMAAAFRWAQVAAEGGLAGAQANLGMMYMRGVGCERDYGEARQWCERAAAQHDAGGALGLGVIYEHGLGANRNCEAALHWYGAAAARGNSFARKALAQLRAAVGSGAPDAV